MQEKLDEKDKETETNTLANSSVYERLHEPDDVQSFINFYNQSKEDKELDKIETKPFDRPL